mmetsp:Transcript_45346/g.142174  ORF Transcript_45346/g.142174 Transcript_45346/m.142174 type:complete len:552 (-) Transcript_45346:1477-3132(-)
MPSSSVRRRRSSRSSLASHGHGDVRDERVDSLAALPVAYRTEHLTGACLLTLALLALGIMLYVLRSVIIPFLVAVVFMYVLQPIVNVLTKAPRRWCDKCCNRHRSRQGKTYFDLHRPAWMRSIGGGGGGIAALDSSASRDIGEGPYRDEEAARLLTVRSGEDYGGDERKKYMHEEPNRNGNGSGNGNGRAPRPPSAAGNALHSLVQLCRTCATVCLDKIIFPRWLAVFIALGFAVGVLTGLGMVIYSSVVSFNWLKYEVGAQHMAHRLAKFFALMDINLDQDLVPFLMDRVKNLTPYVLQGIVDCFSNGVFVLIFLMYLLMTPVAPPTSGTWGEIDLQIRRYIRLKTLICTMVGVFAGLAYWVLGVDLAFLWALLTFFLQYIPNVGPIVATFMPMPLVILDPTLTIPAKVSAFMLPGLVHAVIGNLFEPRLFGDQFELHPVMVLIALAFWSVLWGVPGMVLSVPLMAVTRIVCEDLDHPYALAAVRVMEGKLGELESVDMDLHDSEGTFSPRMTTPAGSPRSGERTLSRDVSPTRFESYSGSRGRSAEGRV